MNRLYICAIVGAFTLPLGARAEGLLDQQLGGTSSAKPAEAAAPNKPIPATAGPAINPDAVRKVDDADLINKLTQPEKPTDPNVVKEHLTQMLDRMGQSQQRLAEKDPGDITQETQRRILTDLDVLIEFARQQCSSCQGSNPGQGQPGQQRNFSQNQQQNQNGSTAASNSFLPTGGHAEPQPAGDVRSHSPEEWGKLGPRDRDLISHGANEQYLSSYRDLIDRYYQALAELGKSRNR
jgi:hypothetical protein